MAKILVSTIPKQQNTISAQVTGFTNAYFASGCSSGTTTAVNMRNYNRTLSYSTNTETVRTVLSTTARMAQGGGGFSSTDIYIIKGFTGSGLSTVVNKITASTDSQSAPTINFSTDRRGPYMTCPKYLNRIYYICGFSTVYTKLVSYIDTSTDTASNTTDATVENHVGAALFTKSFNYLFGGYTTGDTLITGIYRGSFQTDTYSSIGNLSTARAQQGGLSHDTFGYIVGGITDTTTALKFRYSTEVISTVNSINEALISPVPSTTKTNGYLWTGYRPTTLSRALYIFNWATDTNTNNSYTVAGDTNNGWLQQSAGV